MAFVTHKSEGLCPSLPVTGHLGLSQLIVTQLRVGWVKGISIMKGNNMSQASPPPQTWSVKGPPCSLPAL